MYSIQTSFVFPVSIIIISIFLKCISSYFRRNNKNSPPGPPKLPLIGNLHQLGSSPHRALLEMAKKHGPVILVHLGSVPMLVASSTEIAQKILKTHDLAFCNRPILKVANTILYGSKDIAFCPYGEHWRQMKSIAVLQLLSNKRVQSFRKVREEETDYMISKIEESCGSLVNLSDLFVSLTNSVVCRVALGKTYRGLKFKNLLEKLMDILGVLSAGSYIPWLSWLDHYNGLQRMTNEVAKEFDELLEGVLEEHINKNRMAHNVGDHGDDEYDGQDLVDILLDVQREKTGSFVVDKDTIKAVILDVFAAGTDTTSTNIEWAVSELVKHPQVMKKLQQEVTAIANGRPMIIEEDLDKMKYLKAVIKETLRIHIPLPLLVQRESIKDVKLMGYDIPIGTRVVINAWALGRDPSQWNDPDEFKPERFLNSSIDYKGFHYQFIPFGSGRRGCPGIQFAIAVNELAIANLVYKYDLSLPDGKRGEELDMTEITGLTTHRKSPLLLVATPRVL
uniref:cytochrome P450 Tp4149-like n=1 Tax=Erigeron canadensis TaxID=72917 RepID=UPI001CB986DF|nr:cytochrome P450 Tp4149-like [Erigeron canadensis]